MISTTLFFFFVLHLSVVYGFQSILSLVNRPRSVLLMRENNPNPVSQILFKATEVFGSIIKLTDRRSVTLTDSNSVSTSEAQTPLSLSETAQRIKKEYENLFWVTGNMDMSLWEDNCTFADPFSSFGGDGSLLRFKSNADNLSRLVDSPVSRVTSFEIIEDQILDSTPVDVVKVGWSFSSTLKLPWRPILAASGVTSHFISSSTGKIKRYEEAWKSKPLDVVLRLFVPSKK